MTWHLVFSQSELAGCDDWQVRNGRTEKQGYVKPRRTLSAKSK